MNKSYKSIKKQVENLVIIEKSKFISFLFPILSEDEARGIIADIRKKHSLATHVCYAFIADKDGLNQKFSDDGEPQGTAGMPMLDALKNSGLKQVLAVVVRYFGGVKLGTGGLVRAYQGGVLDAVKRSEIVEYFPSKTFEFDVDFKFYSGVLSLVSSREEVKILGSDFGTFVTLSVACKEEYVDALLSQLSEITSSEIKTKNHKELFIDF